MPCDWVIEIGYGKSILSMCDDADLSLWIHIIRTLYMEGSLLLSIWRRIVMGRVVLMCGRGFESRR